MSLNRFLSFPRSMGPINVHYKIAFFHQILSVYKDGRSTHNSWVLRRKGHHTQNRSCSAPSPHVFCPYCSIMTKWVHACSITQLSPTVCDREYWSKTKSVLSLLGEIRKEPRNFKIFILKTNPIFPKVGFRKVLWGTQVLWRRNDKKNWWKQYLSH